MAGTFEPYGASHAIAAAVGVAGAVGAVVLGRLHRDRPSEERISRGFAVLLAVFTIPLQIRQWLPEHFRINSSIPLQVCDIGWMVAGDRRAAKGRAASA